MGLEQITVLVAIAGLIFTVFFNNKNSGRASAKDIEERVKRDTRVDIKLDDVLSTVKDIKYDIGSVRKDVAEHSKQLSVVEKRLDVLEGGRKDDGAHE